MSKKSVFGELDNAYMYYPTSASTLEGEMLTFIETLGMEAVREKAVKDVTRGILYKFFNSAVYISPQLAEKTRREWDAEVKNAALEIANLS